MKLNIKTLKERLDGSFNRSRSINVYLQDFKMIVFSDQHKGQKDKADDFLKCKPVYHAALGYYHEAGYHLTVLGDVEELWESRPKNVMNAHLDTFDLEKKFAQEGRYTRIMGNHDDMWDRNSKIDKFLKPVLGDSIEVSAGKKFNLFVNGTLIGTIFVVHGHQGSTTSDLLRIPARFLVRNIWGPIQRFTGIRSTTPSTDFDLRTGHEMAMHEWIKGINLNGNAGKVIMIAGHTHHPVFASETHDRFLEGEIAYIRRQTAIGPLNEEMREKLCLLMAELEYSRAKSAGKASLIIDSTPVLFNSGCCSFSTGIITGIEISDGNIALVRWPNYRGELRKRIIRSSNLIDLFQRIQTIGIPNRPAVIRKP